MAVSPLIMVRFSKFEIWHTQDFDADLPNVPVTSGVMSLMQRRRQMHFYSLTSLLSDAKLLETSLNMEEPFVLRLKEINAPFQEISPWN